MIILDTNVISELMRGSHANETVIAWVRAQAELPVTTVINRAEIMAGIAMLPGGQRRASLQRAAQSAFSQLGIVLPLSLECADVYAQVVANRRMRGRPIAGMDTLVASIATVVGATVATRDTADFSDLGLNLVNPWSDS